MTLHVVILISYSLVLMAVGLWIGRRVRGASGFFVADRQLGPGLIFSTMLAANIGAGSTVGAAGIAYSGGVSAWWWVGSAALGSAVLAFWIGPAIRREAASRGLRTVGDYLEYRYSRSVRGVVSAILWLGSIQLLGAQLIALGTILDVVAGVPFAIGCSIGGLLIIVYFSAGGLLTAAWVNVIQLAVKLSGFALALPLAVSAFGGWGAIERVRPDDAVYWNLWRPGPPGLMYLAMLVPAFIVSPGLLQKIFGARDDRAVRLGVGANAVGLLVYAAAPVILGIVARGRFADLPDERLALPMILLYGLPPVVGAIGLAAVFSAEVSAADAALFMLTTSLSQDLYKRFANPQATDVQVLRVARWTTIVAGSLATTIAIVSASIIGALTFFYTLLGVTLFVPILAGLYSRRTSSGSAIVSIAAGVIGMLVVQTATGGKGWALATPALVGLAAAIAAWTVSLAVETARGRLGAQTTSS